MKKKSVHRHLVVSSQTIRRLDAPALSRVGGGVDDNTDPDKTKDCLSDIRTNSKAVTCTARCGSLSITTDKPLH